MNERLGFIGVGAMGGALVHGLTKAGTPVGNVDLCIRREERAKEFADLGFRVSDDPIAVVTGADVIVIAVKPGDVTALLEILPGHVTESQVLLSIVAGVPTSAYEAALGEVPVVRAMPNTPAIVGEGIAAVCRGAHATDKDLELAVAILDSVGLSRTTDEATLDAVTAISGTGPAYVFLLAEALTEAALREGIPRTEAEALVNQTIRGAGHLLTETDASPTRLRGQVTSPGGTTAAAVHVLEERGFRALVEDAVRAAAARSRELGRSGDT